MQNDANFTNENVLLENILGSKTEIIETPINLTDKNATKILSVSACFFVNNTEILVGEINYTGNLQLNVVYLTDLGEFENLQIATPLSSRFENSLLNVTNAVRIIPNIISNEIENVSADNARVKTMVELEFYQTDNQNINIYNGGDENVFVRQTEIPLSSFICKNCSEFTQSIILDSKTPIGSVVSVNVGAIVKKAESLDSIVVLEGELHARILARTKEETPRFITLSGFENFREEIEDGNATRNSLIEAYGKVICENVTSTAQENDESIEVSIPVKLCYKLYNKQNVEVVTDAFSTTNEIALTTTGFNSTEILGNENFNIKIDGNVALDDTLPRVDKILAVDGEYLTFTNIAHAGRELLIEGILHANVIYLNDDENTINSVAIEIPFSQTERTEIDSTDLNIKLDAILYDVDAVVKRGRDIYLDGKIKIGAWFTKTTSNAVISGVEILEEIEVNSSSIEIYFAKEGQTLWDIAKDLKVSKEILIKQNESLPEVMLGGERVIYFNQKTIEIE